MTIQPHTVVRTWAVPAIIAIVAFGGGVLIPLPHGDGGPLVDINDGMMIAAFAGIGGFVVQLYLRMGRVETELSRTQTAHRNLWAYCRALIDLYYRHRKDGSPDPGPLPDEP